MADDESTTKRHVATATAYASRGRGLVTTAFLLMFITGNCDVCSGSNRDYLGDAVDALSH
jgi:hypothetical protein